jgi:hypothetical protein
MDGDSMDEFQAILSANPVYNCITADLNPLPSLPCGVVLFMLITVFFITLILFPLPLFRTAASASYRKLHFFMA